MSSPPVCALSLSIADTDSSSASSTASSPSSSASSPLNADCPPAKSTRSASALTLRRSSASGAFPPSPSSASSLASPRRLPPASPASSASCSVVLPPSPSRQRQESGLLGLVSRFDSLSTVIPPSAATAASSSSGPPAASPQPPSKAELKPTPKAAAHMATRRGGQQQQQQVTRAHSGSAPLPSPSSAAATRPSLAAASKKRRTGPAAVAAAPSNVSSDVFGPQPSSSSPLSATSTSRTTCPSPLHLLPAARSLSVSSLPSQSQATRQAAPSGAWNSYPCFRSITHDFSASPSSSPVLRFLPSPSPLSSASSSSAAAACRLSPFHPLSPNTGFLRSSFASSPLLLPQPNFDQPPSPALPSFSPLPPSSPSPSPLPSSPSPSSSPESWYSTRAKLPLCGKTADGVALISCATVAELLRSRDESIKRRPREPDIDADTASDSSSTPTPASESSSPPSSSSSSSPAASPPPASFSTLPAFEEMFDELLIFDCRFAYEFNGGHIASAVNITSFSQLTALLMTDQLQLQPAAEAAAAAACSSAACTAASCTCAASDSASVAFSPAESSSSSSSASPPPSPPSSPRRCLIFHCEYSQSRAPQYFSSLRRLDSTLRPSFPLSSSFPDMYVMEGGYRRWVEEYSDLCQPVGGYVEMRDKQWRDECGRGLKERKQERRGEMERKRRRQQRGAEGAAADDDSSRRITRSSTAAAGMLSTATPPVFRRTSSCSFSLSSAFSPIPLSLCDEEPATGDSAAAGGGSGGEAREERRSKREKR